MKKEPMRTQMFMECAIKRFGTPVFQLALVHTQNRADAEDVFQEAFLRLYLDGTQFADDEHLKAWLLQVTVNVCRDLHRSAWSRRRAALTENIPFETEEDSDLWAVVAKLPQKYRDVIHLYYQEGYSAEEIGHILGRKTATVRTQMCRARELLKKNLGGISDEEQVSRNVHPNQAG
ncbi:MULTISPECIES: RNA polymerase sigma factor [Caproicibacterium]|uniref:Sigma-70 family RNA polymerase sigma factor n=1 Tax=Caproicibacterium argilliputei TaxID=3030016 RepID=A0AA97D894_9FIRM|nr:sigma-70 family RNA polymerase sigma factor [Caproicibacterium argilliputei]WOC32390.1 sigma-70 family RNA polymerase sigma factor [Caproicibacterium argilliputei]